MKIISEKYYQKYIQYLENKFEELNFNGVKLDFSKTWLEMGLDSLDQFDLIINVETDYNIIIIDVEAEKLDSPEKLIQYLINLKK